MAVTTLATLSVYHATMHDSGHNAFSFLIHFQGDSLKERNDLLKIFLLDKVLSSLLKIRKHELLKLTIYKSVFLIRLTFHYRENLANERNPGAYTQLPPPELGSHNLRNITSIFCLVSLTEM